MSQLFADPAGQTARRMPEFLDLRGQRAAATGIEAGNHRTRDPRRRRKTEAAPFDGRIAFGIIPVEEVAVLDEQQRVDYEVRNAGEVAVDAFWELRALKLLIAAVVDAQPGPILFAIDRKRAGADEACEVGRP